MVKIMFEDKVALNENPNIADINKVNASDMNEIKQVVNENANTLDNKLSNTYGTSQTEGYSQKYINKIGTTVNLFGNVGGSSVGTFDLYSHIVATKINSNTWKFEIEGQMDISGATQQYNWGIIPSKISNLLNSAIGKQVVFDESLRTLGTWDIIKKSTKLPYLDFYNYGTTFEFNDNAYFLPARYYLTNGSIGGHSLDSFENGSFMRATIYLREL